MSYTPGPLPGGGGGGTVDQTARDSVTALAASLPGAYAPLVDLLATVTAATGLTANKIRPVDATAGAVTMTALPALSSLAFGTRYAVAKTDGTRNPVTVPFAAGDTTSTGDTSTQLTLRGTVEVQVVSNPGGGKFWRTVNHVRSDATLRASLAPASLSRDVRSIAPGLSIVGDKANGLQFLSSDGVVTDGMAEFPHDILRDCFDPQLVFANTSTQANADGLNQNGNGWNPITVNSALANQHLASGGTRYQVTFGGKSSVTIESGGWVLSDPVSIDLAAASVLWERTHVTVASGGKWPTGTGAAYLETGTTANDKTLVGDVTGGGNKAYGAVAILARLKTTGQMGLYIIGDSWSSSGADWGSASTTAFPVINFARTGESVLATNASPTVLRRRLTFATLATHCEHAYGINDFQNQAAGTAFDLPAHKARYIAQWRQFAARGLLLTQWTCTPKTTSTDAWATLGNQTNGMPNVSTETARVAWNNWLRDGAPLDSTTFAAAAIGATAPGVVRVGQAGHPLQAVFEMADLVESARDSGIWKAGYTSDGVHPNSTGNAIVQAARVTYWTAVQTAYALAS